MIELCVNGIIRLLFILIKFGISHWGWTITLIVGLLILLKIGKMIGFKAIFGNLVELGMIEYILFLPILFILLFAGLIIGTYITTLWSGHEFCQVIEEMTTWLL
jgi:hypothetical protein